MTELVNHATERSNDAAACAIKLLHHYGFDLGGYRLSQLLIDWQQHYPTAWIRLATIEALYQGRYKAVSVEQILAMWQRRNQPLPHFNHEFERLVCDHLPDHEVITGTSTQNEPTFPRSIPSNTPAPQYRAALQLPSFEKAPLPEADVMLALKTLHSREMAALQAGTLPEAASADTPLAHQPNDPASTQTYSYSLRSEEPSPPTTTHEPEAAAAQNEENQPLASIELPTSETIEQPGGEGKDTDVRNPSITDATFLAATIAPLSAQADNESQLHHTAAIPLPSTLSIGEVQATLLPPIGTIANILQQLEYQKPQAKTEVPALGLIASSLKPKLQLPVIKHYQPIWLADPAQKQPIHQFTPIPEPSAFYSKLKAVAQPLEKPPADESQPDR